MKYLAIFAALPLALGAPAFAQDQSADQHANTSSDHASTDASKTKKPEEKKICEMQVVTGSIYKHRVCRTQTQIAEQKATADSTLENLQDHGRQPGSSHF